MHSLDLVFVTNLQSRFLTFLQSSLQLFFTSKIKHLLTSRKILKFLTSVAKGLNLKNATNLPNHAKNHATKKTLKRSHIFGQRRHNFDQLKIFSIAFFSQKIRNCHDLGKRRHNLSWRRHKSDILNQIIKRRHIFELWRVHATSNFMAPQGGPKTPLWRDHATFGNTGTFTKFVE